MEYTHTHYSVPKADSESATLTRGYLDFTTPLGPQRVESLETRGPDGPHPARAWVDLLVHVDLALTELQSIHRFWYC